MTILEDPAENMDVLLDRRRAATGPRRSWASTEPFVTHPRPVLAAFDAEHWGSVAGHYVRQALVVDLCITAFVILAAAALDPASVWWAAVAGVAFLLAVAAGRGYDRKSLGDGPVEFQAVLRAGVGSAATVALGSVALAVPLPRVEMAATVVLLTLATAIGRHLLRRSLHGRRSRGVAMSRTLVVGDASSVHHLIHDLRGATYHGYQVVGVCLPAITDRPPQDGVPTLGALADIPQVAYDHQVDVVIVSGSELSGDALRRLSWALGRAGVDLVVSPGLVEVLGPRVHLRPTAGLSLLEVETSSPRRRMLAKSALDRTLGTAILLAASPIIAFAAVAVRLTSRGPAFFRQRRIGVDGREFTMWKLRSMYVDAEERKRGAARSGATATASCSRCATTRGSRASARSCAATRIDELPQLWNVVRGDMSLVGPRPPLPAEVDEYHDAVYRRLRVRPGLTGLWQVSGRADLSWDESVRLDLRYVDNWSVAMDLMILWKTGRAVFGGSGAY